MNITFISLIILPTCRNLLDFFCGLRRELNLWYGKPAAQATTGGAGTADHANLDNMCGLCSATQCVRAADSLRRSPASYSPMGRLRDMPARPPTRNSDCRLVPPQPTRATPQSPTFAIYTATSTEPLRHRPTSQVVMTTKTSFPVSARAGPQGQPVQQDALQFYSGLLINIAAQELRGTDAIIAGFADRTVGDRDLMEGRQPHRCCLWNEGGGGATCDETAVADMLVLLWAEIRSKTVGKRPNRFIYVKVAHRDLLPRLSIRSLVHDLAGEDEGRELPETGENARWRRRRFMGYRWPKTSGEVPIA